KPLASEPAAATPADQVAVSAEIEEAVPVALSPEGKARMIEDFNILIKGWLINEAPEDHFTTYRREKAQNICSNFITNSTQDVKQFYTESLAKPFKTKEEAVAYFSGFSALQPSGNLKIIFCGNIRSELEEWKNASPPRDPVLIDKVITYNVKTDDLSQEDITG